MRKMPSKEDLQELLVKNRYNPTTGDYRGFVGVRYGSGLEDVVYFRDDFATTAEIYYVEKQGDPGKWVSFMDDISYLPTLDDYDDIMEKLNAFLDEHYGSAE
jgi:hypothetical protein